MNDGTAFDRPRKLSRDQARIEQLAARRQSLRAQLLYWSRKSIPERLAAMTALNERMYRMRGIAYDEQPADFTPRRVRRSRG